MPSKQFSIVVALYNAAEYFESFMQSLRKQKYPFDLLDIVIVDDGSTDESLSMARNWEKRYPEVIRTVSQPNGGPASARNAALPLCRNEWITMCDPDDILDPHYFVAVAKFLERDVHMRSQMLSTRLVEFQDGEIRTTHNHPLNWKFRHDERLVDLDLNPEYVHLSGGTAFLRRAVIEAHSLRFNELIRPKFEDAHFIGLYLAHVDKPIVGVIPSAKYLYRKQRINGASLVQGAWDNPGSYHEVPMLGYYGLLSATKAKLGYVPAWAQCMVLYDLLWAYIADKSMHGGPATMSDDNRKSMHASLDHVLSLIDTKTIREFTTVGLGWSFHNMLLGHYKAALPFTPVIIRWSQNANRKTSKYSYMHTGPIPEEEFVVDGQKITPLALKSVEHHLFGRVLIRERVFTLPTSSKTVVYLNRTRARITSKTGLPTRGKPGPAVQPHLALAPVPPARGRISTALLPTPLASTGRRLGIARDRIHVQSLMASIPAPIAGKRMIERVVKRKVSASAVTERRLLDQDLIRSAKSPSSPYKNAWVLLDRVDRADDNAEHLYRYLSNERPDINAWFLLDRNSKDWHRLAAEGFKLVEYGSDESVKLVLNAKYKISSHADRNIQYPIDLSRFGEDPGKIVFLQHGVTKDDLSRWINPKKLSLIITATRAEFDSIGGTENSYKWTADEVKLTGFPRHDTLHDLAENCPVSRRQTILIAPTWRQYLTDALKSQDLAIAVKAFEESTYGQNWLGLLRSDDLAAVAKRSQSRIRFLGHPNLSRLLPALKLPDHIEVISYDDISVQEELVQARVLISDFSSISFDAAYAGTNIIYYQFDGDEIYRGGHVYRKGYFDYQKDGFGPLAHDHVSVLESITALAERDFDRDASYEDRIRSSFPYWDGKCSARVTAAIEDLDRPWYDKQSV
ncbi:CDP-glycerol glycerophosphotransferase family protein [Arthrobacter sunyaminii]|uniref:CDP-glycerol glycerophosphotransferase family protein n=1 Tax=Arthrobacter sunyaminii TaxID=2816859 RepID=UPI001A93CA23|nr:CDP-glycerol glycerophosphotransferase family protein [Arthrobacter sunyaminii]MBO0896023.1 CDP-glycerol glycerophosphotransferase family protein [Arthrobacter sunyaminii]